MRRIEHKQHHDGDDIYQNTQIAHFVCSFCLTISLGVKSTNEAYSQCHSPHLALRLVFFSFAAISKKNRIITAKTWFLHFVQNANHLSDIKVEGHYHLFFHQLTFVGSDFDFDDNSNLNSSSPKSCSLEAGGPHIPHLVYWLLLTNHSLIHSFHTDHVNNFHIQMACLYSHANRGEWKVNCLSFSRFSTYDREPLQHTTERSHLVFNWQTIPSKCNNRWVLFAQIQVMVSLHLRRKMDEKKATTITFNNNDKKMKKKEKIMLWFGYSRRLPLPASLRTKNSTLTTCPNVFHHFQMYLNAMLRSLNYQHLCVYTVIIVL